MTRKELELRAAAWAAWMKREEEKAWEARKIAAQAARQAGER